MTTALLSSLAPALSPVRRAARRRHRLVGALAAGVLLALGGITSVAAAPTASAHAELTGMTPADRATVATVPIVVVLHFTEPPVTVGLAVRVTGPRGDVQQGTATIDGHDVVQQLLPSAPAGAYRVAWRVTADDGHASSGELTFTATAAHAQGATAATAPPAVPETSAVAATSASPVAVAAVVVVLALLTGLALVLARRSRGDQPGS